jgi:hypothetical protein
MKQIRQLLCIPARRRDIGDQLVERCGQQSRRHAYRKSLGQVFAAGDYSGLQCRIALGQLPRANTETGGQVVQRDERLQIGGGEVQRDRRHEPGEIPFDVLVNLFGREERHVEISRRESEGPAVVLAQNIDVGRVAVFLHRSPHAAQPMVVGSNRHRPIAGDGVVVGK